MPLTSSVSVPLLTGLIEWFVRPAVTVTRS